MIDLGEYSARTTVLSSEETTNNVFENFKLRMKNELDIFDEAILDKASRAYEYHNSGSPIKDVLTDDDVVEIIGLLLDVVYPEKYYDTVD